jgi:hypothetical protein
MTALTTQISYHVQELERVATDLRNERTLRSSTQSVRRRMRVALGNALVQIGVALAPSHGQVSAQTR